MEAGGGFLEQGVSGGAADALLPPAPWRVAGGDTPGAALLAHRGGRHRGDATMCGTSNNVSWVKKVGTFLGWGSAVFYLGSRVAQIVRNQQRASAEGLSEAMFLCAFCANLTYGAAILLRAKSWYALVGKVPWLLGSMGTLSLDVTIFCQALYYRAHMAEIYEKMQAPSIAGEEQQAPLLVARR